MALAEFLQNVRTAARLIAPKVASGDPQRDQSYTRAMKGACLWLTPAAVKGFDSADLAVFPLEKRTRLQTNVDQFLSVARTVPSGQPVTDEQYQHAYPAFESIVSELQPYLDWEAIQLTRYLEEQSWPASVVGFATESGTDSGGEPAFWLWIILRDEQLDAADFGEVTESLRRQAHQRFKDYCEQHKPALRDHWLYVRFRTFSEEKELLTEGVQ